jgi:hypothetical protein
MGTGTITMTMVQALGFGVVRMQPQMTWVNSGCGIWSLSRKMLCTCLLKVKVRTADRHIYAVSAEARLHDLGLKPSPEGNAVAGNGQVFTMKNMWRLGIRRLPY